MVPDFAGVKFDELDSADTLLARLKAKPNNCKPMEEFKQFVEV